MNVVACQWVLGVFFLVVGLLQWATMCKNKMVVERAAVSKKVTKKDRNLRSGRGGPWVFD